MQIEKLEEKKKNKVLTKNIERKKKIKKLEGKKIQNFY